jgi:hypothetical protein
MENTNVSSQRGFKRTHAFGVALLTSNFQSRGTFPTAARVRTSAKQQLQALGMAVAGGNVNWRKAVLFARVDVAARSLNLFPVGMPKGYRYVSHQHRHMNTQMHSFYVLEMKKKML